MNLLEELDMFPDTGAIKWASPWKNLKSGKDGLLS